MGMAPTSSQLCEGFMAGDITVAGVRVRMIRHVTNKEPRKAVQESGSLSTQGIIPSYQENYLNSFQGHSPVTWGPPTECHLLTSPHWGHVYSTHSFGGQTTRKPQQLPLPGFSISELCFQEVVCFPLFFDLLIFPNSKQPPTLGSELLESNYS